MRRWSLVFLLLAACIGQTSPDRTPLPDAASIIPEPEECQFLIGAGQGVLIEDIVAESGADGVLQIGDVLVSVNDQAVASAGELRQLLTDHEVGETITVTVEREGSPVEETVDLGSNPDAPERPQLGVMVTTAFTEVAPVDLDAAPLDSGDFARSVSIGGRLYAFDPVTAEWTGLELETPTENWVAAGGRVLYLEGRDEGGSALIDSVNEEQLVFEVGDWNGSNLLGSFGNKVIVAVTRPVVNNDEQVEVAVMLVDFAARNAEWIWQVTADSGIPIASYPSPTGSQILLIGEEPETGVLYHSLLSAEGTRTGSVEVPAGYVALGWFDEDRILVGGEGQGLQIVDLGGADPVAVELPAVLTSLRRVWPVGDGTHVLGESGNALVRFSTDPVAEVRTLADNCQIDSLGDLGWSA